MSLIPSYYSILNPNLNPSSRSKHLRNKPCMSIFIIVVGLSSQNFSRSDFPPQPSQNLKIQYTGLLNKICACQIYFHTKKGTQGVCSYPFELRACDQAWSRSSLYSEIPKSTMTPQKISSLCLMHLSKFLHKFRQCIREKLQQSLEWFLPILLTPWNLFTLATVIWASRQIRIFDYDNHS